MRRIYRISVMIRTILNLFRPKRAGFFFFPFFLLFPIPRSHWAPRVTQQCLSRNPGLRIGFFCGFEACFAQDPTANPSIPSAGHDINAHVARLSVGLSRGGLPWAVSSSPRGSSGGIGSSSTRSHSVVRMVSRNASSHNRQNLVPSTWF